MVVAVAAALDALEIIALRGLDVAQSGAAAHNVQNYAGQLRTRAVADAFLLQGDAGAGGGSDGAHAGTGRAVDHVDCRNFAFRLQEAAAHFRHTGGHILRNFCLRCNRIAEEESRASPDGRFSDRFAALHQS